MEILKQAKVEKKVRCESCHCQITDEQVAKCKDKFKNLDFYRNRVYCEKHLQMILDRLEKKRLEKWREKRRMYAQINPRWYFGDGLYRILQNQGYFHRGEGM